jgi:glycerophosphoryl diester phosphodiesterase
MPLILGHRGAPRAAPENTIAAFAAARALGADGVELDVRRTADGELVVHHDPQIEGFGVIVEHPFARVRAAHPELPTLAEALAECAGMLVNIEIKCLPWEPDPDVPDRVVARGVIDLVRETGGDVIISSFDLGAVDWCRKHAPEIPTGLLTSGQPVIEVARLAAERGHAWLNPDRAKTAHASPDVIAEAHALGLRLSVWTVDDPDEARALAKNGVDAIISNVPDVIRAAFGD